MSRTLWRNCWWLGILGGLCAITASRAEARTPTTQHRTHRPGNAVKKKSTAAFVPNAAQTKAYRRAQMDSATCLAELARLHIGFKRTGPARGVQTPVRLTGKIGGIRFSTGASRPNQSPYEVFDCRMVVALADFAPVLRAHGVKEVRFSSGWRPPPASWPIGKAGRRHPGGLAIDIHRFELEGGGSLDVDKDFDGKLDAPVCGPRVSRPPATPNGRALRSIVCTAAEMRLFQSILTPNFNRAHKNHLHIELVVGVRWFILS